MSLAAKILEEIEKYDQVMEAVLDSEATEQAAHECIAAIRLLIEEDEPKPVNLNNPIAQLYERAQRKGLQEPVFEFGAPTGASHMPQFTCVCIAEGVEKRGKGGNKQKAKRMAAKLVLEELLSRRMKI